MSIPSSDCSINFTLFTCLSQPPLACAIHMDNNPLYSASPSSDVISQAPAQQFAQGLDSSQWDCLLTHMVHGIVHDPLAGEDPGLQCTSSISGYGRPGPYSGLEILSSWQPHQQNHSTLVSESDQSYEIPAYNVQLDSLTQFMNTGSLCDHWSMQDHTAEVLNSDDQEGNGDLSKYMGFPLVPPIAAQAMMKSHRSGLYTQQGSVAQFTPMDDRGTMAPTMKLPSARRPLRCVRGPCGWVKENGTRCNTSITYDCARHLAIAHGIRQQGRHFKVLCHWCSPPKSIRRSGMLRHVREVHLNCPR